MKKKTLAMFVALTLTSGLLAGCGNAETVTTSTTTEAATETASTVETTETAITEVDDQAAAGNVAALIDAIYVQ